MKEQQEKSTSKRKSILKSILPKINEEDEKRADLERNYSKKKIAIEILIGFLVTIACTLAGMYFYISAVSNVGILTFIKLSIQEGFFQSVIGLGALLDFLAFFVFMRKGQWYRVRGVLLGVLLTAAVTAYFLLSS